MQLGIARHGASSFTRRETGEASSKRPRGAGLWLDFVEDEAPGADLSQNGCVGAQYREGASAMFHSDGIHRGTTLLPVARQTAAMNCSVGLSNGELDRPFAIARQRAMLSTRYSCRTGRSYWRRWLWQTAHTTALPSDRVMCSCFVRRPECKTHQSAESSQLGGTSSNGNGLSSLWFRVASGALVTQGSAVVPAPRACSRA